MIDFLNSNAFLTIAPTITTVGDVHWSVTVVASREWCCVSTESYMQINSRLLHIHRDATQHVLRGQLHQFACKVIELMYCTHSAMQRICMNRYWYCAPFDFAIIQYCTLKQCFSKGILVGWPVNQPSDPEKGIPSLSLVKVSIPSLAFIKASPTEKGKMTVAY